MNNTEEETQIEISLSAEDRFRKAATPLDFALVIAGLLGEGSDTSAIISAAVDAKIENSLLPEGTTRESVKNGISTVLECTKQLLTQSK